MLVLGGLISDNAQDNVQKVPALGDIPVVGNLFRYRSNDHQKQNLMVFLHPRILRDAATEAAVSSEKYNYIRTEQLQMRDNHEVITPRADMPMMPEVHDFLASPALDVTPPETPPGNQASAEAAMAAQPPRPRLRIRAAQRRDADRLARRRGRCRVPRRRQGGDARRAAPLPRRAARAASARSRELRTPAARALRTGRRCARDGRGLRRRVRRRPRPEDARRRIARA